MVAFAPRIETRPRFSSINRGTYKVRNGFRPSTVGSQDPTLVAVFWSQRPTFLESWDGDLISTPAVTRLDLVSRILNPAARPPTTLPHLARPNLCNLRFDLLGRGRGGGLEIQLPIIV